MLDQKLRALDMNNHLENTLENLIQNFMECVNKLAPEKSYDENPVSSWITNNFKKGHKKRDNFYKMGLKIPEMTIQISSKHYGIKFKKNSKVPNMIMVFAKLGTNPTVNKSTVL